MSLATVSDGQGLERPAGLNQRVLCALRLEVIGRFHEELAVGLARQQGDHLGGEIGVGVDAGAHRGATQRQFTQGSPHVLDAANPQLDLARVPAEFLPQADRRVLRCVRPIFTTRANSGDLGPAWCAAP
jgi:hypothetical protein